MSVNNGRNHQSTPPNCFEFANERWGPFDIDAAASDWNAKCELYYDEEDDSLSDDCPWVGRVWVNPPWANIEPFVDKAIEAVFVEESAEIVVMLLPTRCGRAWFIDKAERWSDIKRIRGRLKFDPPPGEEKGKGGFEDAAFFVFERPIVASGGDL